MITPFHMPLVDSSIPIELSEPWEMASQTGTVTPARLDDLQFLPAQVPGTAASVLREQGLWRRGDGSRFDASQYWFRYRFDALRCQDGEQVALRMGGIATIADVSLNGTEILKTNSMFADHEMDVSTLIRDHNELLIACRPLTIALREKRGQKPQPRWR